MHEILMEIAKRTDWTQVFQAAFVMVPLLAAQVAHMILAFKANNSNAAKLDQIVNGGAK